MDEDNYSLSIFQITRAVFLPIFSLFTLVATLQIADGIWRARVNREPMKFLHKYFRPPALGLIITQNIIQIDQFGALGIFSPETVFLIRGQFWVFLTVCIFVFVFAILDALDQIRLANGETLNECCTPKIYCQVSGLVVAVSFYLNFYLYVFFRPYRLFQGVITLNVVIMIVLFEARYVWGHRQLLQRVRSASDSANADRRAATQNTLRSWNNRFYIIKVFEAVVSVWFTGVAVGNFLRPFDQGRLFTEANAFSQTFNVISVILTGVIIHATWERLPWFQRALVHRNRPALELTPSSV